MKHIAMIAALLTLVCTATNVAGQQIAQGYVYHDLNNNAARDANEPGVPNVRVSNGQQIVRTNDAGAYSLPIDDDTIIFVIKPRGWHTAIDKLNIPRFYYIHKPAGSPQLKYAGVTPTGNLPDSVDFPLYKHPEPDRYEVLLLGDTQPHSITEIDYLAHDIIEPLIGTDAAFCVSLGDLVYDKLDLHEPLNRAMAHLGIPIRNILGNHDMDYSAAIDKYSDEWFEHVYGPPYYSFDYGPAHYIVLDDVVWVGAQDGEKGSYHGGLGAQQMEFIRNDLAQLPDEQLIVLTMHIPLVELAEGERDELFELLAKHPHAVSFSGHWHTYRHWFLGEAAGWPGTEPHHHTTIGAACGSWWHGAPDEVGIPHTTMRDGAPNGWCVLTINGNSHSVVFRAARRPANYQMNIHTPEVVPANQSAETEVLVNVFAGSERSVVEMRVDGGKWTRMQPFEFVDPYFAAIKQAEESDHPPRGHKLPRAEISTHIWKTQVGTTLKPGTHLIEVRTTDLYGQEWAGRRIFRVK